jgi:phosphoglycerate dehydrogenase-like enzyme
MPKLLILSKNAPQYCQLLESATLPGLEISSQPTADCEVVFGDPNLIRDVLAHLPALKWVQATWAGVEQLLDPALRRDYMLTNARGVFGGLMSEFVFGYLLLHERKMLQRLEAQRQHRWDAAVTGTLRGKTIGLLGVGSIGAALAATAKFFGMRVWGYTRESEASPDIDRYFHGAALGEFVAELDYLVSVLPNTRATRKIIGAELLATLPKQALLINVGRGSAVDEAALIAALEAETIAGAVLDVFDQEPLPAEHPFWETKHLLITSHSSAPSFPEEIMRVFVENYGLYVAGEPLQYQVDFEKGY